MNIIMIEDSPPRRRKLLRTIDWGVALGWAATAVGIGCFWYMIVHVFL
jgi:hypothetical protein